MKTVVVISTRNLFPGNSGDKLYSACILSSLHSVAKVHLINLLDEGMYTETDKNKLYNICTSFDLINYSIRSRVAGLVKSILQFRPLTISRRAHPGLSRKINAIIHNINPDVVIWDHLRSLAFYSSNPCYNVLMEHNNEYEVLRNQYNKELNIFYKYLGLRPQLSLMKRFIHGMYPKLNKVVLISASDEVRLVYRPSNLESLEYVPLDFTHPEYKMRDQMPEMKVLFTGSLDWFPNSKGILWFLEKVLPLLDDLPLHLYVVGRNPDRKLRRTIAGYKRVSLLQNVPDISVHFLDADIFINPVSDGSGINIKIPEALSYGIPIVSTTFGVRGYRDIPLRSSDLPEEFAGEIRQLYNSPDYRFTLHKKELEYYNKYRSASRDEILKVLP